jgi:uncharacterized protein YukE
MASLTPLVPFSHDWVGGNIHGLQGIAQTLCAYLPQVQDLAGQLSVVANDLTSADGWQGSAASAFSAAWQKQALTMLALEEYVTAVAQAINNLAVELSKLENGLEQEAADAAARGVQIAANGSVAGSTGGTVGAETAIQYQEVYDQTMSEATAARQAATRSLYQDYELATNSNPHPNVADDVTMADLLADLLAAPTAARREVNAKVKKAKGEDLKIKDEIADAKRTGKPVSQKTFDEEAAVDKELDEVTDELKTTGKLESGLSKLLDSRVSNVQAFLAGQAGTGKHVGGNTPDDLKAAAAEDEPGSLSKLLDFGNDIPVVDIGTALLGTGVSVYYDVKGGQTVGSALVEETSSNTAGTVGGAVAGKITTALIGKASTALADGAGDAVADGAADAVADGAAASVGASIGEGLGAAAGPVGIAVGAVVGYGVGDLVHNIMAQSWSSDVHNDGVVGGVLYGAANVVSGTADDARETVAGIGHDIASLF